jgi:hypothetical protein
VDAERCQQLIPTFLLSVVRGREICSFHSLHVIHLLNILRGEGRIAMARGLLGLVYETDYYTSPSAAAIGQWMIDEEGKKRYPTFVCMITTPPTRLSLSLCYNIMVLP